MIDRIKEAFRHPWYFPRKVNRIWHQRGGLRANNPDGVAWMEEDWDVLTILDACRYDIFAELAELPGTLSKRESKGCHTLTVLRSNFDGETNYDTVYVTAMPVLYNAQRDQLVGRESIQTEFHAQIDVWKSEGWDDDTKTVVPETMVQTALQAADEYPDKQLILHFSQPHCPFIGPLGRKHYDTTKRAFWKDVMDGKVDTEYLEEAYRENLEAVLPKIETLMTEIEGKHVVTSDHGQLLGERAWPVPIQEWGHPPGIYLDDLVNVPWLEHTNGKRRPCVEGVPEAASTDVSNSVVEERLADLGYVNY